MTSVHTTQLSQHRQANPDPTDSSLVRFADHIGIWVPARIRIYVLQKRPGWERDPVICQKIKKLQALEALEDEAWVRYQPIVDRIAKLEGQSKLDLAEQQELCELETRMVWERWESKRLNAKAIEIVRGKF